jgi:hypothetical protein
MGAVTLPELRKANFVGLTPEFIRDIQYFEQLSTMTQTDISSWPVIELLSNVPAGNKREINKLFFERSRESRPTEVDEKITQSLTEYLIKERTERTLAEVQRAREQAAYYIRQAQEYHRSMAVKLASAHGEYKRADDAEGKAGTDVAEQVKKALTNPFWEYTPQDNPEVNLRNGHLYFRTRNPVVMSERNDAAGIHRQVNLGKFKIKYTVRDAWLAVVPWEGNTTCNGIFHPYISAGGDPCWGTAAVQAGDLLVAGKFGEAMSLLATLLTVYSPSSSPYLRLIDFERQMIRNGTHDGAAMTADAEDVCADCGDEPCSCSYCEPCDQYYSPRELRCPTGNWCPSCEECFGSRRHCESHWCDRCSTYTFDHENDRCTNTCPGCDAHINRGDRHVSGCGLIRSEDNENLVF